VTCSAPAAAGHERLEASSNHSTTPPQLTGARCSKYVSLDQTPIIQWILCVHLSSTWLSAVVTLLCYLPCLPRCALISPPPPVFCVTVSEGGVGDWRLTPTFPWWWLWLTSCLWSTLLSQKFVKPGHKTTLRLNIYAVHLGTRYETAFDWCNIHWYRLFSTAGSQLLYWRRKWMHTPSTASLAAPSCKEQGCR